MSRKSHEHYTAEFKAEAVKLVLEASQSITVTAIHPGIAKQTFSSWLLNARLARLNAGLPGRYQRFVSL